MTNEELLQLRYLNKEIELTRQRLDVLAVEAEHANRTNRAGIMELTAIVSERQQQNLRERNRLEQYIADISDSFTRQIFTLRFADGLEWEDVAGRIGYHYSGKYCGNLCYRYLKNAANANPVECF